MLELRDYTKEELVAIYGTDKVCNITRSMERAGYKYVTNGKKGKNYRLTITALPHSSFKELCVSRLGIPAQSDFYILRNLFYYIFCDEELSLTDSALEQKLGTTRQTIRKWIDFFIEKGLLVEHGREYSYYVAIDKDCIEISREEYLQAWRKYWEVKQETGNSDIAFAAMIKVNGGIVSRAPKREENGFYSELIDALVEAIEREER
jgi:hypothetical protein